MKKFSIFLITLLIFSSSATIGVYFFNRCQGISQELDSLKQEYEQISHTIQRPSTRVIEKSVTGAQLWRPIQERIRDTVVQVFSHITETDLLQPYKTPNQGTSSGSGFFINDQGDFITNAHVIDQARAIWIQIPSLGKRIIDADVVGVSPDRDIALLRVSKEGLELIRKELGSVPYLNLGDSDLLRRSDEVLVVGYPLGQQSLKSTTGVVSGYEQHLIQMSAALNPGNSGGPLLNLNGDVIGINTANIPAAQNVGYATPINDLKIVLPDLYKIKLLRKPFLGILYNNATDSLTQYLKNPYPGGCYVVEVVKESTLEKAGVKRGDMIYEINGYSVDMYGEMAVPWSEDKISLIDYVTRLSIGQELNLTVYRNGERKHFKATFDMAKLPAIRKIYPGYEQIDYEVFAGMVVMQLSLNHIHGMASQVPGLARFAEMRHQGTPILLITHIFPNSQLYRSRSVAIGSTLNEVNGVEVHTLDELRVAYKESLKTGILTVRASDHVARATDNVFVALDWQRIIEEEPKLSRDFRYPMTANAKEIVQIAQMQTAMPEIEEKAVSA